MPSDEDSRVVKALHVAADELSVGPPAYRNRVRRVRARRAVVVLAAVGLTGMAVAGALAADGSRKSDIATAPDTSSPSEPSTPVVMELYPTSGTYVRGETMHVTGTGCPPTGHNPISGGAVGVKLSSLGGIPGYGFSFGAPGDNITINVVNYASVPGQITAVATPREDGSWEVDLAIPIDAPLSDEYMLGAICASRLDLEPDGRPANTESTRQALVSAGPFTVEAE